MLYKNWVTIPIDLRWGPLVLNSTCKQVSGLPKNFAIERLCLNHFSQYISWGLWCGVLNVQIGGMQYKSKLWWSKGSCLIKRTQPWNAGLVKFFVSSESFCKENSQEEHSSKDKLMCKTSHLYTKFKGWTCALLSYEEGFFVIHGTLIVYNNSTRFIYLHT